MHRRMIALAGAHLSVFFCLTAVGQSLTAKSSGYLQAAEMDNEPKLILEAGAATSWNLSGGAASFAPNFAAEMTPVEKWLEIEAGVSPFYTRNATEWDTDLLFKKPWTLSPKVEFMLGAGPEWIHLRQNGKTSNILAGELAGDFMFWPGAGHHFGWYFEPAYDCSFAAGHAQSIGMSGGLLIGIPGSLRRRGRVR